ncbi:MULTISPECIES: tetratricopeptide repeat-containing sensor histidine kinase [unclassified Mucilaginibacter]|uniref:tetratricopeptide repeat-containing sensor histidine kinase n=1 Tax=unclassified Mucilaginibacter TaxID=2617802 RepID=UPI002AC8D2C9|nr:MULTISPECIES: tetratricopeptide repeat-containing sensor histidine kinase [unclassified Mucilaginibacter]MEB0260977.1 tetratricopeptide repeat-containing sensor histidine kinase [Mucilaginibacter sp. 10I4]MEB0302027.1 tetratricopeptide repeat-containing sensor histidine kinase [Mucilaginibacter sp. 5C4]WPX22560.1 tetratricopeptide repeat-containing sensor histidine kinase [Mucilaginibacter sp. 5C4]
MTIGLDSCRQLPKENPNHTAHADSLIWRADELQNSDHPLRSLVYLDSVYRVFPYPGPVDLWKKYRQKSYYYLNYDFNPNKARFYADSMALVLNGEKTAPDEHYAYAWTLFTMGNILLAEKKYAEAFKNFYDGRVSAKKNLDNCNYCQFSYQLGLVRFRQGQYGKSMPYLKQALAENGQCKASPGSYNAFYFPQTTLNTIALCYERINQPDSAVAYYRHALDLIDRQSSVSTQGQRFTATARGVVLGNLGGVYVKLNKYREAEKYLKESIRINDRPGYAVDDAQTAKLKLVDLDIRSAHYPAADSLLRALEAIIAHRPEQHMRGEDIRIKWLRLKWAYYDRTGKSALAYAYVQKYDVLRDSVADANKGLDNADMEAAFKSNEQQYQVALLNKENQTKKISLLSIIVFAVMACGILMWRSLKRSRMVNKLILAQNKEIITQNEQLQKALSALEQSQADNTRMMKIVAHDLRNPISGMFSIASMMLDDPKRAEEDKMLLELITISGQNSLELVSNLLQVHMKVEELKKEPVDLGQLLHYCVDLLRHKAEAKGQQIYLQGTAVMIPVNREKLWRVVSNLIANAIKFSPTGAIIRVSLQEEADHVRITVEDHGIGIPQEIGSKIFDMFTEAKRVGTGGEESFGLGLAIAKQIVDAHGGKIWFDSKPGNGTTFFVELPL